MTEPNSLKIRNTFIKETGIDTLTISTDLFLVRYIQWLEEKYIAHTFWLDVHLGKLTKDEV